MNDRMLIVARMAGKDVDNVSRLFAASDRTTLPHMLGVRERHLFTYGPLYFHYVRFDGDRAEAMRLARRAPGFELLSEQLSEFVTPYDPRTWSSPADAMAENFYSWMPENER